LFKDNYDLPLSCSSAAAGAAYIAGVDQSLRLDHPGIAELEDALGEDPEFALAHAALARQLQIHGFSTEVVGHLEQAVALKPTATQREQSAIDVIVAAATFEESALGKAQEHIEKFPRDVLVLAHVIGPFGLLAFSGDPAWREENVVLLKALESSFPADDWWYLSSRSFLASEVGDLTGARNFAEHAWRLSENGNCAHSWAHLHFEAGAIDDGMSFIKEWAATAGTESDMRHHLIWHLALLLRETGAAPSELMSLYERELDPRINDPMPLSTFSDNAALLWRCKLSGLDVPNSIGEDLINYANKHYPRLGFSFADIHRVMSVSILNDAMQQDALIAELSQMAVSSGTPLAEAMVAYAEGFRAFVDQDFATAAKRLKPFVADSVLLGGSNPQRAVIEETYQAALIAVNQ
jgi:hypothetical protein